MAAALLTQLAILADSLTFSSTVANSFVQGNAGNDSSTSLAQSATTPPSEEVKALISFPQLQLFLSPM